MLTGLLQHLVILLLDALSITCQLRMSADDNQLNAMQYMAGGDLLYALTRDIQEVKKGETRQLDWYSKGRTVLLNVACGLAYLHSRRVRLQCHCCEQVLRMVQPIAVYIARRHSSDVVSQASGSDSTHCFAVKPMTYILVSSFRLYLLTRSQLCSWCTLT